MDENKKIIVSKLEIYVKAIIEKYGCYIPSDRLEYLKNIDDYSKFVNIYDYGSINGFASSDGIGLPLCVNRIFNKLSKIPGYGINKNHKSYNNDSLIINNNTFVNYLIHVFVSGTDSLGYYEDLLLHETMHFCGSGGSSALKEGINELLTRKLALDKGFRTNGCGYPNEVKIAYELENILGEDTINSIAFMNSNKDIYNYLVNTFDKDAAEFYFNVNDAMEKEFYLKYYRDIDSYNGIRGIIKKTVNYKKIDYSNVYKLIEDYKNRNNNNYIK